MQSEVISKSTVYIHARTDVGKTRAHNEDNFIVCPQVGEKCWHTTDEPVPLTDKGCLLVVADGMGGANAGEIASEIAVEVVRKKFDGLVLDQDFAENQAKDYLYQSIIEAHKAIVAAAIENPTYAGMGTTILMAWVFSDKAVLGWCGDSRAYLHRKKQGLKILTKDHSLVWELVEAGQLTVEEADVHPDSNIITQSLGDKNRLPRPDITVCRLEGGDRLLLCSDGLNNMLTHLDIAAILAEEGPLSAINEKLIERANEQGGEDNITVVSLEVEQQEEPTAKKSKLALWLLPFLAVLGLAGWFLYYTGFFAASTPEDEMYREAGTEIVQEESAARQKALDPRPPEQQTMQFADAGPEGAIAATAVPVADSSASEVKQVVAKYHLLDSMISLRPLNGSGPDVGQDSLALSGGTTNRLAERQGREQEADRELNSLLRKYYLGNPKTGNSQQLFLDSLSGNDKRLLSRVSKELARIETLIRQEKTN
ncbi:PP2C family serine/threonine-protein phosphatase [Cesiribacter sp. SM1]|uniref:PP2C family protein-serine/threonine phosphatase n=1 Tax=Cesiribacter sp. SM1 TaxID=2861196 RepID=UPI001CD705D1|nr:PP2C family serine/threonine-protein phosphatase [Cesiribacter sp. SM1]